MHKNSDSHELRPLTGIRGIAAIAVVFFHFSSSWYPLMPALKCLDSIAARGWLGVDLFFILSGLILSYVYTSGDKKFGIHEYKKFLWFRLARIYPNHIATLGFLVLLVVLTNFIGIKISGKYPIWCLPFEVTLTQGWPFIPSGIWNYPSWSISAEWFAYLCIFPISWRILRCRLGAMGFLFLGYFFLALWLGCFRLEIFKNHGALLQVSCEFMAGSLFFGAIREAPALARVLQKYGTLFFIVILAIAGFLPLSAGFASYLIILVFPLLLISLTSETSFFAKSVSTRVMLWLGKISYAMYMSHAIVQKLIKVFLPSEHYAHATLEIRALVLFTNMALILLGAVLLYYLVEIPARNLMRRMEIAWMTAPK